MAYGQNQLIEATHFNSFRTSILNIYGVGNGNSGYGQSAISIPTVTGGTTKLIASAEWVALRDAMAICANHQGVGSSLVPPYSALGVNELVRAHPPATGNFASALTSLSTNRLTGASTSYTLSSNQLTSSRSSSWSSQLIYDFNCTFSSVDQARYFFNSGGQIRIRASRSGGTSSSHNTSWTNLLNSMGSIRFGHNSTASSSGTGTGYSKGYYTVNGTDYGSNRAYQIFSSGSYSANSFAVFCKTQDGPTGSNGDNGRVLNFRVVFQDDYSGGSVTGTTTVFVDVYRATTHLTIAAPTMTTTFALAGS